MNKDRVSRRLNLLGSSAGSVVSVATWCCLHAQYADVVVGCLMDKLKSESTPDAVRASVLYVAHEMVLTCVSSGTTETGKQSLLVAISKSLPSAVQAVLERPNVELTVFTIALDKVLTWWAALRAFPSSWLSELQRKQIALEARLTSSSPGASPTTASAAALSLPGQLQRLTDAMARYRDAKEQWVREQHQQQTVEAGGSPSAATPTVDIALRQLAAARKTAESVLGPGAAAVAWCDTERAELLGLSPQGADGGVKKEESAESPTTRIKLETSGGGVGSASGSPVSQGPGVGDQGAPANDDDDDDVLGAFYGS